ncbi:class I SAM-dependent methyltransferase [Maribacter thermophilus]|uniref:class I SAM-dependent methyltransferase n=1 Tax=Maribacter thermophilus TaxID=1197874 RepID=UPI0006412410|nr:class I SAM-dependent methyltransferase [Maribacter thermophilus]
MNQNLLKKEAQEFISNNLNTDVHGILLKNISFANITAKELVEQIESKSRAKNKLPTWFSTHNIYYPNKLNLSQTSSEATANYKAAIINGKTLVDLTGGFGVDAFAFAKRTKKVIHIEKNSTLSSIAGHNFKVLEQNNIVPINEDGVHFIQKTTDTFDWIYVDPSRRDKNNKKVFFLEDCEPNVIEHLDLFFSKSPNILIKTGPLLDIKAGLKQLDHVTEVHIVASENEVKEVLWVLKKERSENTVIKTINLKKSRHDKFQFNLKEELGSVAVYSAPLTYLYEPNAAIMKSGGFQVIAKAYGINKLNPHSHLYTSNELKEFPGRRFLIDTVLKYNRKEIKSLGIAKANITSRNFPDSVEGIRKKLKLKEGGDNYLFFTKDHTDKPIVISCKKVF